MQAVAHADTVSKPMIWTGWVLSAVAILFLLFDSVIKVLNMAPAVEATTALGYNQSLVIGLGVLELVCLALYAIPRTAVLGATLFTGYLGGALASQVRIDAPLFSLTFPLLVGVLLWGGLFLREARLRALIPLRRARSNK